jgi:hypothetical protein
MREELGDEVGENPEECEAGNTVTGQYPGATTFIMLAGRLLRNRGDDRGPIFHAKPPKRKIVAQVGYASRLPTGVWAKLSEGNFTTILEAKTGKCHQDHRIHGHSG